MKITKKLETEILELYNKYWNAYLKGKMRIMSSLMDENCMVIGSGQGEVFSNRKTAIKYYKSTADQVTGKAEMRNRRISISPAGNQILISEKNDFFVLMDSVWTFYGPGRISTLFAKSEGKWKIIHQHGSLPDACTGGGEQPNTDKIREENVRLKNAVKRRTIELEDKNRELEIEASLEKVRASAMSIHKSEDLLSVSEILYRELRKLGFNEMRNALINIHNDANKTFLNYDYSDEIGKSATLLDYNAHPVMEKQIKQSRIADDAFSEAVFKGKDLEAMKEFRRKYGEKDDPRIKNITALYYYFYSIGNGTIGISTFIQIDENKLSLLKRFRNVFNLAYKRYSDITLAETQAREAEIELALERVRARSMAMQKSEELKEVIKLVYEQFVYLKINVDHAGFVVDYTPKGDWHFWIADQQEIPSKITHPYFDSVWAHQFIEAKEKGMDFFATNLNFEEKNKFYNELLSYVPGLPDKSKDFYLSCPGLAATTALFDDVSLYIENFSGTPYSDEENKILLRFGKVFQQTYTRFLDLKKAETQAREAQIEASLEKVRAVAMSMHKSDDLISICEVSFKEFQKLGFISIRNALIHILNDEKGYFWDYDYSDSIGGSINKIYYKSHPILGDYLKQIKSAEDAFAEIIIGDDQLNSWREFRKKSGQSEDPRLDEATALYYYLFSIGIGDIGISTFKPIDHSQIKILKRFRNVFDLAYRRYTDIAQAEAQARESQIQLALERVRARTMAMQKSDELAETAYVLYEQFGLLGENPEQLTIGIIDETQNMIEFWLTLGGNQVNHVFKAPIKEPIVLNKSYIAWKEKKKSIVIDISGDELKAYYNFFKTLPNYKEFNDYKSSQNPERRRVINIAFFSKGSLSLASPEPKPAETIQLLERFAGVLDQTYTRFLDLQKAETQARESQIEAALERVRSRSMAMHHTSELQDVINTVHQQFKSLDIAITGGAFIAINEENKNEIACWGAGGTADYVERVQIPLFDQPIYTRLIEGIQKGPGFFTEEFSYDEKIEFFNHLFKNPPYSTTSAERKNEVLSREGGYTRSCAVSKYTNIFIINHHGRKFSEEENNILIRFGKVFEQSYTRFLDLQKAEAQARESQIQLALERVRARTMAMHKSEELSETSFVLFEQLKELGEVGEQISITVYNEQERIIELYATIYGNKWEETGKLPFEKNSVLRTIHKAWKEKEKSIVIDLSGEELDDFNEFKMKHNTQYKSEEELPKDRWVMHYAFFSKGALTLSTHEPRPAETIQLLERFAGVFDLTYTRFLDLKKAESQAREAMIEVALEKIRSLALGMRKSEEVGNVTDNLFAELNKLSVNVIGCSIVVIDEEEDIMETWRARSNVAVKAFEKTSFTRSMDILKKNLPEWFAEYFNALRSRKNNLINEFKKGERSKFLNSLVEEYNYTSEEKAKLIEITPKEIVVQLVFSKLGYLALISEKKLSDEDLSIAKRFVEVFDFAYTRFLDIKKAEAQAREAQIEAALERIRSRAMGMQSSDELLDVANILREQMGLLGQLGLDTTAVHLYEEDSDVFDTWYALRIGEKGDIKTGKALFRKDGAQLIKEILDGYNSPESSYTLEASGSKRMEFFRALIKAAPEIEKFYKQDEDFKLPEKVYYHLTDFSGGSLVTLSYQPPSDETKMLQKRAASVFDLAYRRYLDLKKAEAQAREAQIENALEKVRSRSLAMHKSDELKDVVTVLFERLRELKITMDTANIEIYRDSFKNYEMWVANANYTYPEPFYYVYFDDLVNNEVLHQKELAQNSGEEIFTRIYPAEIKNKFWNYLFENTMFGNLPDDRKNLILNSNAWSVSCVYAKHSGIVLMNYNDKLHSEEELNILKRFSRVFEQAYVRFRDLQIAETQAREAQIETALERVRSRTMAMQHSDELAETAGVLFEQFVLLGINPKRCVIGIIDQTKESAKLWFTSSDGKVVPGADLVPLNEQENLIGLYQAWKNYEQHFYFKVQGQKRVEWTGYMVDKVKMHLPEYQPDNIDRDLIINEPAVFNNFFFSHGFVMLHTAEELQEADLPMLKRFAGVFEQTYTRFLDLKNAEAQAKEAIRQASLDRIRGEIASMRTTEDLNRITPIIWRELKSLEVPFIRCGVFIVDEGNKKVQVYLSTPDGKALGALDLFFDSTKLITNTVNCWKKEQVYKEHWNKEQFIKWTKSMIEIGQVQNAESYQGSVNPPESLHLNFVPFTQGMLYVGDASPLTDEKLDLVKTLAEAFSIAYARYEDFKNIEDAKNKIEITLDELKAAQAQLVHSEKMASLGELTAGIAHEIKNPLNFVNNFSEISGELVSEIKEELEKNDKEEILAILEDLKQNLEKINQHGKRADSIVKGMLLHSRGTAGEKTLTDINDLLDQYVNLAYHGMRATNKEFNITIEKDYDETLEKINVVPQDISRVFLNIINNACYAAYNKKSNSADNFSPTLKVSTKKTDGKVEIKIEDNGNGIPKDILDKIFQPFFTTKPTGEGTGLGLSLSYDIVTKVHGGDLKVETKEGEGTGFIISLKL